ncbi:hypothetical protein AB0L14_09940 [Streptomyces sp. NPDC052727]|uniref:hypothetical protein n=1 Tax=Streptomyces sp. NPDC052727 TaxID=3154854 RepID=UPI003433AB5C
MIRRPQEIASMVVAILPSTAGGRIRLLVTSSPRRSRWVLAARALTSVHPSRICPSPLGAGDRHQVVPQPGVRDLGQVVGLSLGMTDVTVTTSANHGDTGLQPFRAGLREPWGAFDEPAAFEAGSQVR